MAVPQEPPPGPQPTRTPPHAHVTVDKWSPQSPGGRGQQVLEEAGEHKTDPWGQSQPCFYFMRAFPWPKRAQVSG